MTTYYVTTWDLGRFEINADSAEDAERRIEELTGEIALMVEDCTGVVA